MIIDYQPGYWVFDMIAIYSGDESSITDILLKPVEYPSNIWWKLTKSTKQIRW